jgi:hypothetical protein
MVALPAELLQAILSFIWKRKDAVSCTLLCKAWNLVAMIRLYEAGIKPEALRTLLTHPDLARLVKHVKVVWDKGDHFDWGIDPYDPQLSAVLPNEDTLRALREGSTSAHMILLMKLLPSLQTLTTDSFLDSVILNCVSEKNSISDSVGECTLCHLTSLQVTNAPNCTLSSIVQCMTLPSLQFLTIGNIVKPEIEPELGNLTPTLYGTSSVEHLRLKNVSLDVFGGEGNLRVFAHMLRIPRRLRTFGYSDFELTGSPALGAIGHALQHVRETLEVLEIYHIHEPPDIRVNRLYNLSNFYRLTHLTAPIEYVRGPRTKRNANLPPFHLLPPSLQFWNIRMTGDSESDGVGPHLPFVNALVDNRMISQLALRCRRHRPPEWGWVHPNLQKRCDDAGVTIVFDNSNNDMPDLIIDQDLQPIFAPDDWRNLGGSYGSPCMD